MSLQVPANAEFTVTQVSNPYGCADLNSLSLYPRPLPSTNLRFSSAVMWDGRESAPQMGTQKITFETNPTDLLFDLSHQANSATRGHAEGMAALTPEQEQEIVDFEMKLVTAQIYDYRAGRLDAGKATGGPAKFGTSTQRQFFVGINDPLGGNPHGTTFTPKIFGLFDAWASGRRDEDKKESELSHGSRAKRHELASFAARNCSIQSRWRSAALRA